MVGDNARMDTPAPPRATRTVSPYLLLTLTPFFWACNWIIGRGLSTSIPPMAMTFFRWFFAIADPGAVCVAARAARLADRLANRRVLMLLGVVGVGSHNALAYLGLNYTTATNGVILNSFIPVMIVALSWIFLRERLAAVQLAGVAGVAVWRAVDPVPGQPRDAGDFELNRGDLFIILSMVMWSIYTICLRWRPVGSAHAHVPVRGRGHRRHARSCRSTWWRWRWVCPCRSRRPASSRCWASRCSRRCSRISSGIVASRQVGANVAGLFVHLMPVFGTILAWMFLGERLRAYHVVGIALILAGIYVTSRASARLVAAPLD